MSDDGLAAFLRARLDEDEYYAKRAGGHEFTFDSHGQLLVSNGATISKVANLGVQVSGWHIARHDPARVLREVDAGRAVVAACAETLQGEESHDYLTEGGSGEEYELARFTLRQLTAAWVDHLDYRPEWKP